MAENGRGVYTGGQLDVTKDGSRSRLSHSKAFRTTKFKRWTFGYSLNESMKGGKMVKLGILDSPPYKDRVGNRDIYLGKAIHRVELALVTIRLQVPTVENAIVLVQDYLKGSHSR